MSNFSDLISKIKISKIKLLLRDKRVLAAIAAAILLSASLVFMAQRDSTITTADDEEAAGPGTPGGEISPGEDGGSTGAGGSGPGATTRGGEAGGGSANPVGVPVPTSGTIPPGIDYANQTIKVVY
ncbi:MAG: hypothetical protein ACRDI1_11800, partial [Actinomycetota bacterium]